MSASSSRSARHRLDDLRRFASTLASGVGVAPSRASALATHLLWFDAAGASSHGIGTLPTWLDRLDRKEIDPKAEGRAGSERAGTAVFDAQNGLPQLALETAAGIASEKARDVGIGIVRVRDLREAGPPAPAAAKLAIGPFVALIGGPGPSIAIAVPTSEGLPVVYDSSLTQAPGWLSEWSPWISAISGGNGWVILAISIAAFEPLSHFHARVAVSFRDPAGNPGTLGPDPWEAQRREAREHGVSLDETAISGLKRWADRLQVPWPTSFGG